MSNIPKIARQQMRLLVQNTPGFTPPPPVVKAAATGTVELDLIAGVQLLWTAGMRRAVSYGAIHDWLSLTVPGKTPHQFTGTSLGEDSEYGGDLSSTFAKIVGLAFMSEYAGACWFKVLKPLWDELLSTKHGNIRIAKKDASKDGPDYLAAPFDPTNVAQGGPFYAVEFKGLKAQIKFSSAMFRTWSAQAGNIALVAATGGAPINLKSWLLAFNYGFERPRGSRGGSALLVEDPEIAPGAPALEADRSNGSSIIRDHLARQCLLLGAPALAPYVRLGLSLDAAKDLPPVYRIDHERLASRRYIGQWFALDGRGDLVARPTPGGWPLVERGRNWWVATGPSALIEVVVHHHGSRAPTGARWLEHLLGTGGTIFVGQDATMLRRCTQVGRSDPLDGEPFQDELHFIDAIGEGPYTGEVRVLRNGSVIATDATVEREEASFWSAR